MLLISERVSPSGKKKYFSIKPEQKKKCKKKKKMCKKKKKNCVKYFTRNEIEFTKEKRGRDEETIAI